MKPLKPFLTALACTWALGAVAQYQWVDKDGRKVFSDRPPPMDVPESKILKQPATLVPARPAATAAPAAGSGEDGGAARAQQTPVARDTPAVTGKDKQLEAEKAKAEAAEASRKQAEEKARADQEAKARAENCARARQNVATLQPGRLVGTTNAQGERGYMDDATRVTELRRAQAIVQSDCK